MAVLTRITDFIPSTLIESQEVDDEFNQLVNLLSGVSTNKDTLLKYSNATDPVLRVDQLGAGVIQQWLQNGSVKSRINNNGSFESIAGPALAASQAAAAPFTVDGTTDIILKANGQIVGYARVIEVNTTATGNVGAGTDSLHSFSLPANSLATDEDFVKVEYGGSFAVNNNDKRIQITADGQTAFNSGAKDIDFGFWRAEVTYTRVSATSLRASGFILMGQIVVGTDGAIDTGNSSYDYRAINATLTVANLTSNAITLLVQAEAVADNDVVQNSSHISVTQMT